MKSILLVVTLLLASSAAFADSLVGKVTSQGKLVMNAQVRVYTPNGEIVECTKGDPSKPFACDEIPIATTLSNPDGSYQIPYLEHYKFWYVVVIGPNGHWSSTSFWVTKQMDKHDLEF